MIEPNAYDKEAVVTITRILPNMTATGITLDFNEDPENSEVLARKFLNALKMYRRDMPEELQEEVKSAPYFSTIEKKANDILGETTK